MYKVQHHYPGNCQCTLLKQISSSASFDKETTSVVDGIPWRPVQSPGPVEDEVAFYNFVTFIITLNKNIRVMLLVEQVVSFL